MKIVRKEAFEIAGIQVEAEFDDLHSEIPKAWKRLGKQLEEIPHRVGDVMTEISMGAKDGMYTELVGVEVDGNGTLPEEMVTARIPVQTYIHHRHQGPLEEIARTFGKILEWAEEKGYDTADFKIDHGYLREGSESEHDLYVKIEE